MGLSSKQVSGDAFDWAKNLMQTGALELSNIAQMRQQHQQQQQQQQMVPPLKCPRCESSNTKFCYYNNYNRSQPRHFCKSCRRHWTKGGTLRNVPVGGGRKNKRQKITHNTNTNTTKNIENGTKVAIELRHQQQQTQEQGLAFGDEKNLNEILYQSLLQPSSTCINNNSNNSFFGNMGTTLSLDSLLPLPNFPCTSLSSLDNNPSSSMASRCQYPNALNYIGKTEVEEDHTISTSTTMPWPTLVTSSSIDPSVYWNWEDLNTLISTDLKTSWDSQNKQ